MGEVRERECKGGPLPQEGGEVGDAVGEPRLIGSMLVQVFSENYKCF